MAPSGQVAHLSEGDLNSTISFGRWEVKTLTPGRFFESVGLVGPSGQWES
jgi:hypothetical protein